MRSTYLFIVSDCVREYLEYNRIARERNMTQYNTSKNGQSVRIGNWYEELRLKEETGIRFYPEPKTKEASLLTKSRCIVHTEQLLPKDYTTVTRTTIIDPKTHPEYGNIRSTVGPRQARLEATLRKQVDEEVENKTRAEFKESRKLAYTTLSKESFSKANFTPTLRENDLTVRLPTRNSNYATDSAVTIYSHAVTHPEAKLDFPTSFVGSINPFRKNGFFSADIRHHVLARRTETYERPKPLPTVQEFRTLTALRTRLLKKAAMLLTTSANQYLEPGSTIRFVLNTLLLKDQDFLSLNELERLLQDEMENFELSQSDRVALISAYDIKNNGNISIGDLCLFIKRTPVARRMELLHFFFQAMEPDTEGNVSCDNVFDRIGSNGSAMARSCLEYMLSINPEGRTFNMDDFFDYYTDASSEIEDDDKFETLLKDTWEVLQF